MPNWVTTELNVEGSPLELALFAECVKSEKQAFDFEKIIPMPDDIYTGDLGNDEFERYGAKNWYDWSIANWGTKWNASYIDCSIGTDFLFYHFDTAWSFCKPVIEALAKKYPSLHFSGRYADEDIGYNCGSFDARNGKLIVKQVGDGSKAAIKFACDLLGYDPDEMCELYK